MGKSKMTITQMSLNTPLWSLALIPRATIKAITLTPTSKAGKTLPR